MDVIAMAREHGGEVLQGMIGEFNLKKLALSAEVQKEDKDQEKLAALNEEVRSLYGRIMAHPTMAAYNTTKEELDRLLNFIQQIIVYSANGEDPATIQEETFCGGDCSGCSGCH